MIRILAPGDEQLLERFLHHHADSSMFLRSNVLAAGLRDEGNPLQATYVASFVRDEITGVASHCWNGNLLLQAPSNAGDLARRAVAATGRKIAGVIGPWPQVTDVLQALAVHRRETSMHSCEQLFALPLESLRVPDALQAGTVTARRASLDDLQSLADWHKSYLIETLGKRDHPDLLAFCREDVAEAQRRGTLFVLTQQDRLVSTCAFSARCLDCVQIGAVWTPSPLRSRGFARTVVAGALSLARSEGVTRSVLFTGDNNLAAQKAYLSLGYSRIGEYGLVLFRDPQQAGTLNE